MPEDQSDCFICLDAGIFDFGMDGDCAIMREPGIFDFGIELPGMDDFILIRDSLCAPGLTGTVNFHRMIPVWPAYCPFHQVSRGDMINRATRQGIP